MQSFFFVKFSHFLSFFGSRNPQKSRLRCLPAHRYAGKQEASGGPAQEPEIRSRWSLPFKNAALAAFSLVAFAFSFRSVVSPSLSRFVQSFRLRFLVSLSRFAFVFSFVQSPYGSFTHSKTRLNSFTHSKARLNSFTHSKARQLVRILLKQSF